MMYYYFIILIYFIYFDIIWLCFVAPLQVFGHMAIRASLGAATFCHLQASVIFLFSPAFNGFVVFNLELCVGLEHRQAATNGVFQG